MWKICGEDCWEVEEMASELYFYENSDISKLKSEGLPRFIIDSGKGGVALYPKERIHAWFRGEYDGPAEMFPLDDAGIAKFPVVDFKKVTGILKDRGLTRTEISERSGADAIRVLQRARKGLGYRRMPIMRLARALGFEMTDIILND